MHNLRDKLYNYEVTPPLQSWQVITDALDKADTSNIQSLKKGKRGFYRGLAAAAITIIMFIGIMRLIDTALDTNAYVVAAPSRLKEDKLAVTITVPRANEKNEDRSGSRAVANIPDNNSNNTAYSGGAKKYIIISGPQGQPVKISPKAALLIVSSDDRNPPNPVWSAKVKRWKDIMKANILGPATANFLDIVDLTHAVNNP